MIDVRQRLTAKSSGRSGTSLDTDSSGDFGGIRLPNFYGGTTSRSTLPGVFLETTDNFHGNP